MAEIIKLKAALIQAIHECFWEEHPVASAKIHVVRMAMSTGLFKTVEPTVWRDVSLSQNNAGFDIEDLIDMEWAECED